MGVGFWNLEVFGVLEWSLVFRVCLHVRCTLGHEIKTYFYVAIK
jgi:hypothetical protein